MKARADMPNKDSGESHSYEIMVSVTLLLVFILVIVTGVMSYLRLGHIIDTVNNGGRPDRKLLLVKEIYNDLSEAENSVKSYSLTRNEDYLSRFYQLTDVTGDRFDDLTRLVSPGDTMAVIIDKLDGLVEQKFGILDRLLVIQDEFRVQQAMDRLMQNIRDQEKDTISVMRTDTVIVPLKVENDSIQPQPVKKENFFNRLFRKKNRNTEVAADTISLLDTIITSFPVVSPPPSMEKISRQVSVVRQEALSRENMLRKEEWELLRQDKLIMDQIKGQLAVMEALEAAGMELSTRNAERNAREVRFITITFVLAASLLLLMAALVIYSYVRKNHEYNQVMKNARERAEELARAKERFLANMSHEIRTPMNIISGFTGQLLESRLDPAQKDQLEMVKKSSDHLLQILNNLLDLSRIQAGKMELTETGFSLREILGDMQNWLEPAAHEKNIILTSNADAALPAFVLGDPLRIRQILLNLVGNAIKFTDAGEVSLRAYPGGDTGDRTLVVFEVTDTGIGISEADQERIFGEFEQASDISMRKSTGAGLGLAITRKLINLLGGDITILSQPGKGATFKVSIPFRKTQQPPVSGLAEMLPPVASLNGLRVLVVDDEEYNLRLMSAILLKYGCKVTEAGSGEESLTLVDQQVFDLVLMDIRLPGMNGSDTAREIRKRSDKKGRILPVIPVSAAINPDDRIEYRKSGMDDFIPKPFEEEQLIRTILSVMERQAPVPVYDLSALKQTSNGDMKFFSEMVELFLKNTAEGLALLSGHLDKREWEKAADMAHKISSPCRHLKADRLYKLLKEAEQRLRATGQTQPVAELIREAKKEFELIRLDIEAKKETK
jgi:signal transduction histidine kinase/CheY-like chemotaxis protein/HPt (histidine-containing phosphotransfer) domain-containing protein